MSEVTVRGGKPIVRERRDGKSARQKSIASLRRVGLAIAIIVFGSTETVLAASRTDVPIGQIVLPDGNTRYFVPITIGGGAPIDAELDTGSFGVRVLKAAVTSGQFEATTIHRVYAFGGGAKFEGVLARATIGVGSVETDQPLLFHLIESVGCVERQPNCPAAKVDARDYRIAGDGYPRMGFNAILGLSMRRAATDDSAYNPLTAMGNASWIVILPKPGSGEPGHLIIDPDDQDRAGFTLLKLKPESDESSHLSGWADAALSGCLVEGGGKRVCGKTLLDSGAPGVSIGSTDVDKPSPWGTGRSGTVEISGADAPIAVPFTSGGDWSHRVVFHPARGQGGTQISAGSLPFFYFAVLYDAKAGTMGFKGRDQ